MRKDYTEKLMYAKDRYVYWDRQQKLDSISVPSSEELKKAYELFTEAQKRARIEADQYYEKLKRSGILDGDEWEIDVTIEPTYPDDLPEEYDYVFTSDNKGWHPCMIARYYKDDIKYLEENDENYSDRLFPSYPDIFLSQSFVFLILTNYFALSDLPKITGYKTVILFENEIYHDSSQV